MTEPTLAGRGQAAPEAAPSPVPANRNASTPGVALTIGVFDGIHRGHRDLIGRMVNGARREGLEPVCITFEPDPEVVLHPERPPRGLSTAPEREARIRALGVSTVEVVAFTPEVARQTPAEFVDWLCARHPLRELWVGPDFALGRNRTGTVETLRQLGEERGFRVFTVEPLEHDGRAISSSWIREALAAGDVELASELLGRPYCLEGTVVTGMRRGRELGFPTANVVPPAGLALPADGVYLVRAELLPQEAGPVESDAPAWYGVANLGARPTFDEASRLLETYLLDFDGDLYDRRLGVSFLRLLRGIQRFSGIEELREQIARDVALARDLARSAAEGAHPQA